MTSTRHPSVDSDKIGEKTEKKIMSPSAPPTKTVSAPTPAPTPAPTSAPTSTPTSAPMSKPTQDAILSKRTEWLEQQERRLTDCIEQNGDKLETINKQTLERFTELFNNTQWLYALTCEALRGPVLNASQTLSELLANYRAGEKDTEEVANKEEWVLVQHPMELVVCNDGEEVLMKMRTVHPRTGQLGVRWAIVGTRKDSQIQLSIQEFAIAPQWTTTKGDAKQ